jgi:hypothetical protein
MALNGILRIAAESTCEARQGIVERLELRSWLPEIP